MGQSVLSEKLARLRAEARRDARFLTIFLTLSGVLAFFLGTAMLLRPDLPTPQFILASSGAIAVAFNVIVRLVAIGIMAYGFVCMVHGWKLYGFAYFSMRHALRETDLALLIADEQWLREVQAAQEQASWSFAAIPVTPRSFAEQLEYCVCQLDTLLNYAAKRDPAAVAVLYRSGDQVFKQSMFRFTPARIALWGLIAATLLVLPFFALSVCVQAPQFITSRGRLVALLDEYSELEFEAGPGLERSMARARESWSAANPWLQWWIGSTAYWYCTMRAPR